uniref:hypothetical protein n=1 Tax=Orrella sp. TaxID=1921583 RepID=UPI0040557265
MTENKNTPIKTPVSGLKVGMTEVPVNTESMPAYYAMPEQAGRLPVVLVIQEIFWGS